MAAMRNTGSGLPVVAVNAYGMAYGAATLALIASLRGAPIAFDPSWPYVVSLLYLSLAGTSLVSTLFEGYRWSLPAFIGLAVLLAGNALALSGRKWLPELDSNQRPTD